MLDILFSKKICLDIYSRFSIAWGNLYSFYCENQQESCNSSMLIPPFTERGLNSRKVQFFSFPGEPTLCPLSYHLLGGRSDREPWSREMAAWRAGSRMALIISQKRQSQQVGGCRDLKGEKGQDNVKNIGEKEKVR